MRKPKRRPPRRWRVNGQYCSHALLEQFKADAAVRRRLQHDDQPQRRRTGIAIDGGRHDPTGGQESSGSSRRSYHWPRSTFFVLNP